MEKKNQSKQIRIREERPEDIDQVRSVNDAAFGQASEGRIVDQLRRTDGEAISLVAVLGEKVVGHIFFSSVRVEAEQGLIKGMGLAPMAVLPEHQREGVGSKLVTEGLKKIKEKRYPFVVVLGHEKYYPRFGFKPASEYGLKCQWDGVPDEVFMVIIYDKNKMKGVSGIANYREEFREAM
ncbi:MAG: N-acetyltransferase [Pseudomonadota bacterium]